LLKDSLRNLVTTDPLMFTIPEPQKESFYKLLQTPENYKVLHLDAGKFVYRFDDVPSGFYFWGGPGRLEFYNEQNQLVNFKQSPATKGCFFGYADYLLNTPHKYSCKTTTPITVIQWSDEFLKQTRETIPQVFNALTEFAKTEKPWTVIDQTAEKSSKGGKGGKGEKARNKQQRLSDRYAGHADQFPQIHHTA